MEGEEEETIETEEKKLQRVDFARIQRNVTCVKDRDVKKIYKRWYLGGNI